jgi:hypothetical protein
MQNNEEEQIKTKFIRQVYQMLYEYKFEELINLININYPSFVNTNKNIIYILIKLNFIKILLHHHDILGAKDFYINHLLPMMKKIYGEKSSAFSKKDNKYQYFLNQINTSQTKYIYFQTHFKFENHLDKFMPLFEKYFEKSQKTEINPVIFNITKSKTIQNKELNINENNIGNNNNNGKVLFKTEHVNMLIYNNENMSEIEDELFNLNLEERKKNIFNVQYLNENKNIINNDTIENDNINNTEEFNISEISNSYASSFNELNNNKIKIKKFDEKREISPINNNKQKFNLNNKIRRVNLYKKIVRKFRKYLKKNIKEITDSFWSSFCRENYLPPFKKEEIEFKSFSQLYLNWLFSHKGGIELYNQFIRHSGDEELNKIYSNYNIKDAEDKITIKNFFINFAEFFANLKLNENMNNLALLNNLENINNTIDNKSLFSEPDFATNLIRNYNYNKKDEDEELSIGSINDLYNEERIINNYDKEYIMECNNRNLETEDNNKMAISSDSSNSSIENINRNYTINLNNNLYKNRYNKQSRFINNLFYPANSQFEESSIINFSNKPENKLNEIHPDMNTFNFDYENKIKISHESIYFLNKEENDNYNENKYDKHED